MTAEAEQLKNIAGDILEIKDLLKQQNGFIRSHESRLVALETWNRILASVMILTLIISVILQLGLIRL
jgi:hypothetical protein